MKNSSSILRIKNIRFETVSTVFNIFHVAKSGPPYDNVTKMPKRRILMVKWIHHSWFRSAQEHPFNLLANEACRPQIEIQPL
jgi:hypothetical protein